jgi:hypothetical protein
MKPIAISSCLALAALSLYAGDPQTTTPALQPAHPETLLSAPRTPGITDSPLVRAAKATNRLNKKPGQVITNETLVRSGGHFTTTTPEAQTQLPPNRPSAVPTLDQLSIEQRRARAETAAAADQARKYAAQKKTAAGLAAARAEGDTAEGVYMDPPALEGETIQTAKPLSPEAMTPQQQKPPL